LLKKLDTSYSPGSFGIDTKILVHCASELSPSLTELFNNCIKRINCNCIKHVTPIYKGKGSKSVLDNYRPISVLTPISKIFEAILSGRIKNYLESNNLLCNNQYGFRSNRSCELALNTIVNDWRKSLDAKEYLISVFLDLSKKPLTQLTINYCYKNYRSIISMSK
jgi:hypothetical protein